MMRYSIMTNEFSVLIITLYVWQSVSEEMTIIVRIVCKCELQRQDGRPPASRFGARLSCRGGHFSSLGLQWLGNVQKRDKEEGVTVAAKQRLQSLAPTAVYLSVLRIIQLQSAQMITQTSRLKNYSTYDIRLLSCRVIISYLSSNKLYELIHLSLSVSSTYCSAKI